MTQVKKGEGPPEEILLRRRLGEAAKAATGQSATKPNAASTTTTNWGIIGWKRAPSESWQCAAAAANEPEEQRLWRPGGRVVPRPGNEGAAGGAETGEIRAKERKTKTKAPN